MSKVRIHYVWGVFHQSRMGLEEMSTTDMASCNILRHSPTAEIRLRRNVAMMRDSAAQKLVEQGIDELKEAHEKEIEELKKKWAKEIKIVNDACEEQVKELEGRLKSLDKDHSRRVEKLQTDHRAELGQERGFLEEARSEIVKLKAVEKRYTALQERVVGLEEWIDQSSKKISDRDQRIHRLREDQALLQKTMELLLRKLNDPGKEANEK